MLNPLIIGGNNFGPLGNEGTAKAKRVWASLVTGHSHGNVAEPKPCWCPKSLSLDQQLRAQPKEITHTT